MIFGCVYTLSSICLYVGMKYMILSYYSIYHTEDILVFSLIMIIYQFLCIFIIEVFSSKDYPPFSPFPSIGRGYIIDHFGEPFVSSMPSWVAWLGFSTFLFWGRRPFLFRYSFRCFLCFGICYGYIFILYVYVWWSNDNFVMNLYKKLDLAILLLFWLINHA